MIITKHLFVGTVVALIFSGVDLIMNRLLIADDEECLLMAYKKLLTGNCLEIDTAQSVSEAYQHLSNRRYDAIMVDLRLSGSDVMDGLEIISFAYKSDPLTKIIVLTAYSENSTIEAAHNAGASYILEKPISASIIRNLLRKIGIYTINNKLSLVS
jgi:CheY-like chemotaxis protein